MFQNASCGQSVNFLRKCDMFQIEMSIYKRKNIMYILLADQYVHYVHIASGPVREYYVHIASGPVRTLCTYC